MAFSFSPLERQRLSRFATTRFLFRFRGKRRNASPKASGDGTPAMRGSLFHLPHHGGQPRAQRLKGDAEAEAQEERKNEWSQVLGAYNRKEEIVLCTKKDEQIMTLDKSKLSESEMKFITDIIDERHLWRTSMPIRTVYLMFGAITFVGVTWIVQAILKVM